MRRAFVVGCLLVAGCAVFTHAYGPWFDEYKNGWIWQKPAPVTPGEAPGAPPSDAIILFDGKDMSAFGGGESWKIEDGAAIVQGSSVNTKQKFGSCQLHVEFATPEKVRGEGQGRGNSGVYLMGQYEVQVLDSYDNETYYDGQCASIYKQTPPIVNASKKPGEWQTYDIIFDAPQFDAEGKVVRPAYMTVFHNGVLVQNHFELTGMTAYEHAPKYVPHEAKLPIHIQNHGDPVRYRNIWIRENVANPQPTKPKSESSPAEKSAP
jgi:hypothetical protein